jgi:2-amino-4-hydroxy-6-hydroxymethyldihydropteridine diphosphokinase
MQLLAALQQVEQQFGRERPYLNAPRTLDLDLLLYDNHMIDTAVLQVPHPRISQRAFVILPLLELDHTITIPGLGIAASFLPGLIEQRISVID